MRAPASVILLALLAGCSEKGDAGPAAGDDQALQSWADQDGDTIIDLQEGFVDPTTDLPSLDSDGDGTPDYLDTDSDDDSIEDIIEAGDDDVITLPWDSDTDGIRDVLDLDSDDNCILDASEGQADLDNDDVLDFADLDDDGDGILDTVELGADCAAPDHDNDGTADYRDLDSDNDGVGDAFEAGTSAWVSEPRDTDGDGTPDYLDDDSDGDGMSDTAESGTGGDATATPNDTDGDGIFDFSDTDSDGDGVSDQTEASSGLDPYDSDTDNDGFTDGAEIAAGTDPTDAGSVIEGIYVTVGERENVEQTFDFTLSVEMGDVAFLLDTTCSMSSTLTGVSSQFNTILTSLQTTLPDAQYAAGNYDDYADGTHGTSGIDKPFWLAKQITSDTAAVQTALSRLTTHSGNDTPESTMEALYQGLTGTGYDMNCNGRYDSSTDVRPFFDDASDPFGGAGGANYDSSVPGTGTIGGFGFRDYALPVIVYATDAQMRDPESSNRAYNATPGGCPGDAGRTDVVNAANAIGAKLIGISVSGSSPVAQMQDLATATNSLADTDSDGRADDLLVFTWNGSSTTLRDTIVSAITDLVGSIQFDTVTLQVDGDEHGFVIDVDPAEIALTDGSTGETVEFTLTFRGAVPAASEDQVYRLSLNVLGDGSVLLDTLDIYVVVPGNSI